MHETYDETSKDDLVSNRVTVFRKLAPDRLKTIVCYFVTFVPQKCKLKKTHAQRVAQRVALRVAPYVAPYIASRVAPYIASRYASHVPTSGYLVL